jgi:hypothetical protein
MSKALTEEPFLIAKIEPIPQKMNQAVILNSYLSNSQHQGPQPLKVNKKIFPSG